MNSVLLKASIRTLSGLRGLKPLIKGLRPFIKGLDPLFKELGSNYFYTIRNERIRYLADLGDC